MSTLLYTVTSPGSSICSLAVQSFRFCAVSHPWRWTCFRHILSHGHPFCVDLEGFGSLGQIYLAMAGSLLKFPLQSDEVAKHNFSQETTALFPTLLSMSGLSEDQKWAISVVERVSSSVSLLSVLFVLLTYLFFPGFNKPINRQIFYATWSNLGICFAGLISVNGFLEGVDTPLCRFQAFLVQMCAYLELFRMALLIQVP